MRDQAHRLRELATGQDLTASAMMKTVSGTDSQRIPKSIAITSGKGGVGKSNIALFLAATLAAIKKRVLLLDADLGLANVHILLGIAPKHTLVQVIDEKCTLEEIITATPGKFDIIPGANGIEQMANVDSGRFQMLYRQFSQLEKEYDVVIVDTGAGIGSTVTQFAANTDLTLIVMTPEPTSLADAYAMVKVLSERKNARIGVVVNMASNDREGGETFDRLNALVVKFLHRSLVHFGTLPHHREVAQYVRRQRLLLLDKGNTFFARRIKEIARRIYGIPVRENRGIFERLLLRAD